ncbi:unnamed protein product [Linum tenue]|uniref:Cytochrome P450 n=1 Tax=Linum tenue TaxID=586396 RepID=A0AAV0I2A3_9ROSI|nr:unnamed protein product [Linum tenue]
MLNKRKEEEQLTSPATDFLGLLVKAYNGPDRHSSITLDDLINECKTFYVAGQETTASSLTWTLSMVINESLRLYPPVFHITREVQREVKFKPERFADGIAKASTFLPFGLGPRTCVGINFGITEEKIALSMILQRHRFRLSDKYVHSPAHVLTICPKHGLQIILEEL